MQKYVLFGLLILGMACHTDRPQTSSIQSQFHTLIDQFPSSRGWGQTAGTATLDSNYFFNQLAQTQDLLQQLLAVDTALLNDEDKIDWRFARSLLYGRVIDQSLIQNWRKDPREYLTLRGIGSVLGRPGELEPKITELKKMLAIVPQQLKNAQAQLAVYVPRFQELGLFMAENGRILFTEEIPAFVTEHKISDNELETLIDNSKHALEGFIVFLKNELPQRPSGTYAIGQASYDRMLKEEFLLPYDHQALWDFGWQEFNRTVDELTALAKQIDPSKSWQDLAQEIKQEYPRPDSMIAAHQYWVDKAAEHIRQHDLIAIPWAEKVTVVPRAEYLRKTSYYGNFSLARGKNADSVFASEWQINPFEDQWEDQRKQEYLTEHDWGVIIVTAPHETYAGHHIQGLYQMHLPSKLRRENGLSLFSEGWGLYNEQLMQETGFFPSERIHLRQLQLRLWRNARVIYDVGMHTGKLSYAEAIALMTDKVGFLPWAAQLEVDAACASPGYFIGYFMGMTEILKLREAYKQKHGNQFKLKDFHEALLKIGNMPPTLMGEVLLR